MLNILKLYFGYFSFFSFESSRFSSSYFLIGLFYCLVFWVLPVLSLIRNPTPPPHVLVPLHVISRLFCCTEHFNFKRSHLLILALFTTTGVLWTSRLCPHLEMFPSFSCISFRDSDWMLKFLIHLKSMFGRAKNTGLHSVFYMSIQFSSGHFWHLFWKSGSCSCMSLCLWCLCPWSLCLLFFQHYDVFVTFSL